MPKNTEYVEWEWGPKQAVYITTPKRYAAYVGAMGCGKTAAFCRRALAIAVKYPDTRGLLARFTYPEVNSTLIPQFMEIIPEALIIKFRRTEGELILRAGSKLEGRSTILFKNLDQPKKYRSENLNFFGISQADDDGITEEVWRELTMRLRRSKGRWGEIPRQYAFLEANYHGRNWYWQLFTKDGQEDSGRLKQEGFNPDDYFLVEGTMRDNAVNLSPEYLEEAEAMPEEWKKRHVYGSWDVEGGLVYQFQPSHISPGIYLNGAWAPVTAIPEYWHRWRAIDHGTRNPTACLWATMSPSGTVYVYDEYYQPGLAMDHAKAIRKRRTMKDHKTGELIPLEKFQYSVIDPSAFNVEGTSGESPAYQYYEAGLPVVKAPVTDSLRDIGGGITVVRKYLGSLDQSTGLPRLQIVSGMAPNLIREFREYVWDDLGPIRSTKRNQPERPRKLKDHALDALRYLLVSRPTPSPDKPAKAMEPWQRGITKEKIFAETWEA